MDEAKEWYGHFVKAAKEIKDLRARLAEVEALCDARNQHGRTRREFSEDVLAAARGEGDRG